MRGGPITLPVVVNSTTGSRFPFESARELFERWASGASLGMADPPILGTQRSQDPRLDLVAQRAPVPRSKRRGVDLIEHLHACLARPGLQPGRPPSGKMERGPLPKRVARSLRSRAPRRGQRRHGRPEGRRSLPATTTRIPTALASSRQATHRTARSQVGRAIPAAKATGTVQVVEAREETPASASTRPRASHRSRLAPHSRFRANRVRRRALALVAGRRRLQGVEVDVASLPGHYPAEEFREHGMATSSRELGVTGLRGPLIHRAPGPACGHEIGTYSSRGSGHGEGRKWKGYLRSTRPAKIEAS